MTPVAPVTAAQALSAAVQSDTMQRNNMKAKHRPATVVGKATDKKLKVNAFATRLSPDTSVSDECSYVAEAIAKLRRAQLSDDSLICGKTCDKIPDTL